jgi:hypothetical protein
MKNFLNIQLFLLAASCTLLFSGCADNKPPSYYQPPPLAVLQDPLPGKGIVYLFRTPFDKDSMQINIKGKNSFTLPPDSYAVLTMNPGDYDMTGSFTHSWGMSQEAFASAQLRIKDGQRAFLYVSGKTQPSFSIGSVVPIKGGVIFLPGDQGVSTARDSRSWKECNEIDAQGFISSSKLAHVD